MAFYKRAALEYAKHLVREMLLRGDMDAFEASAKLKKLDEIEEKQDRTRLMQWAMQERDRTALGNTPKEKHARPQGTDWALCTQSEAKAHVDAGRSVIWHVKGDICAVKE